MIHLISGTNQFGVDEAIHEIVSSFGSTAERYDGESLTLEALADIMIGQTLFSTKRLVIVRNLSANTLLWSKVGEWADRLSGDITLVLVEPQPDRRTKGYKVLKSLANLIEVAQWSDRDVLKARQWIRNHVEERGGSMTVSQEVEVVERAMVVSASGSLVIDQGLLAQAFQAIVSRGELVTDEAIDAVLAPSTHTNVFRLLEVSVRGERNALEDMIIRLRASEDAYKIMGLLASQWSAIVAMKFSGSPSEAVRELGMKPFMAQSAAQLAARLSEREIEQFTHLIAELEYQMKSVTLSPWSAVERFLYQLAVRSI